MTKSRVITIVGVALGTIGYMVIRWLFKNARHKDLEPIEEDIDM